MRKFHFIWEFLEGNRKRMAAMIILVCVYAFLNLCSPLLFSFMIDNVIHAQPANNPVLAWLLNHLGGAASVSYTHLDVYKRQAVEFCHAFLRFVS